MRVDQGGALGGDDGGGQGDRCQRERDEDEGERVGGADREQQARQQAREDVDIRVSRGIGYPAASALAIASEIRRQWAVSAASWRCPAFESR